MGPAPIALDFAFPVLSAPTDFKQVFSFNIGLQR
jgi:outer membrane protein assembly factor BamA